MHYHIQEGHFDIPDDGRVDRSMNVLAMPDGTGVSLIVSRDALRAEESLLQFVERQMGDLQRQVGQLQEIARNHIGVGPAARSLPAIEIATRFKQNGQALHQRQAVLQRPGSRAVLVLTASSFEPFGEPELALWQRTLASFQLRD